MGFYRSGLARIFVCCGLLVAVAGVACGQNSVATLTSPELWAAKQVPFSFRYGGKTSSKLLHKWVRTTEAIGEGGQAVQRYSYADPRTHLVVTAEVRLYRDAPGAVDWVLRFRNDGHKDSRMLEDILPLDWAVAASGGGCVLHHARGSNGAANDFEPLEERFAAGGGDHLESAEGDSSSTNTLPFFNLQDGDHGLIGAVGWTGNWKADFRYAGDGESIALASGMKRTHLVLHPGEEIRTPRIVLMQWSGGDWVDAQNAWRRLLFAHYSPQKNGGPMSGPMPGPVLFGSWGSEAIDAKLAYVRWVHDHDIPVELYAVDAGWYGASVGFENDPTNPWWKNRGDWFASPKYYPQGLKPLGNVLKEAGFGFSLWVETEMSMTGTKMVQDQPGWFLHTDRAFHPGEELLDLGNPAAREGATKMLSKLIADAGMTWYRQDFNVRPERYWELADAPDRIGMSEIGHITGLYRMLDELRAKHPGLRIDNCASGGRRLDIEMMSRSFVNWRSDYGYIDTLAEQAQTQALAPWVPENMAHESYGLSGPWNRPGPYTTAANLYLMRLAYDAGYQADPGFPQTPNDAWVAWMKQALGEYREVQPYFYGDFYPLLPYSRSDDVWTAWQLDRPVSHDGVAILLRRPKSAGASIMLGLRHLDAAATYVVEVRTTYEPAPTREMLGSELAGLVVELNEAPASALVFYRKK